MNMKEKIYKLIDEYGLSKTQKMLGLPISKIIQISNYPINCEIAYEIIISLFEEKKLPENYKEFTVEYQRFEGTVMWRSSDSQMTIEVYATPFWEGECKVPINIINIWYDGQEMDWGILDDFYKNFRVMKGFKDIDDLTEWMKKSYYPKVYEEIIKSKNEIIDDYF